MFDIDAFGVKVCDELYFDRLKDIGKQTYIGKYHYYIGEITTDPPVVEINIQTTNPVQPPHQREIYDKINEKPFVPLSPETDYPENSLEYVAIVVFRDMNNKEYSRFSPEQ